MEFKVFCLHRRTDNETNNTYVAGCLLTQTYWLVFTLHTIDHRECVTLQQLCLQQFTLQCTKKRKRSLRLNIYVYYWHRRRFIWKCPPPFIHAKLGSLARVLLLVISFLPLIGTIHIGHFISRSSYEVRGFQTYSTHTIYGTAHTTLFK